MTRFEDGLWMDLTAEHASEMAAFTGATTARRRPGARRPVVLGGGAVGAAVAAGAAVLALSGGAAPAFAVTRNADGSVTVTLSQISGMSGLNQELAADGINERAVPMTATCSGPAFSYPMPSGTDPSTYTVTIDSADIPAGYTGVLAAEETSSGQVRIAAGAFPTSDVPTCVSDRTPVFYPASPGSGPAGTTGTTGMTGSGTIGSGTNAGRRAAEKAVRRALARSGQ